MALPDFICIGAQKAGTSWLYQMLIQHPDLWLPPLKELHFFDRRAAGPNAQRFFKVMVRRARRRFLAENRDMAPEAIAAYEAYLSSIEADDMLTETWYRRIFDYPEAASKVKGEITPAYLDLKQEKFDYAIGLLPPTTKFIAILREPLARSVSQLRMEIQQKKADPETKEDWQEMLKGLRRVRRGHYLRSIPMWNEGAGKDRILYLPFSDVRERPQALLSAVEDFLGVSRFDGYSQFDERIHVTKKVEIPEWVVQKLEADAEPQREFLIETFGKDFYEKTK